MSFDFILALSWTWRVISNHFILYAGVIDADKVDDSQIMGDDTKEVTDEERDQSDEKRSQAMKAFSEQQYDEAIKLYNEAIQLNPQSALLFAKRGQVKHWNYYIFFFCISVYIVFISSVNIKMSTW